MTDLTKLMNDVQRSVIEPQDRATVCKAVQEYYKYLAQVGYIRAEEAEFVQKDPPLLDIIKSYIAAFNKTDLVKVANELEIETTEEMTRADIIKLIGE